MENLTPQLILKDFGSRIRELRKLKALSQEELADRCQLDRTYIGGVERGERNVSLINIIKLSLALGVDVREFFVNFPFDGRNNELR